MKVCERWLDPEDRPTGEAGCTLSLVMVLSVPARGELCDALEDDSI